MQGILADAHRYQSYTGHRGLDISSYSHRMAGFTSNAAVNMSNHDKPAMQHWFEALLQCCADDGDILGGSSMLVAGARGSGVLPARRMGHV